MNTLKDKDYKSIVSMILPAGLAILSGIIIFQYYQETRIAKLDRHVHDIKNTMQSNQVYAREFLLTMRAIQDGVNNQCVLRTGGGDDGTSN